MSKEIKGYLKAAREAIRLSEYKDVLKNCKAVLKLDKSNYNALVFIGKAATEMQQFDQAEAAYRRATQSSPDLMLAWQGLVELFEKNDEHTKKIELVEIYDKLLQLIKDGQGDNNKIQDIGIKLAKLCENVGQIDKAVATWVIIAESSDSQDCKTDSLKAVISLVENKKPATDANRKQLLKYYEEYLNQELDDKNRMIMYQKYINLLCHELKMSTVEEELLTTIESECLKFSAKFTNSPFPLEILAQLYLRDTNEFEINTKSRLFMGLAHIHPTSKFAYCGLAKILMSMRKYMKAKHLLRRDLEIKASFEGWYLLAKAYFRLHQYSDMQSALRNASDCIEKHLSACCVKDSLKVQLQILNAQALWGIGNKSSLLSAADILASLYDRLSHDIVYLIEYSKIKMDLGEIDTATKLCSQASEIDDTHTGVIVNQAWIHFLIKEFDEAERKILIAIQGTDDIERLGELYYKYGRILWDSKEENRIDKSKCLAMFLKAAKIDPFHSNTFHYLGLYYKSIAKDIHRARKCFEKAYDLDKNHDEAAMMLADTCTITGDNEAAVKIYKSVTEWRPILSCKWAWLRLGLYQMDHMDIIEACISFQNAIRADPVDPWSWECLGDAYKERGSYTAAIKAYARCVQLAGEEDTKVIYPLFQVASIKHLLGLLDEAIADYKKILEFHADYVPVLIGIAKSLFAKAMDCTGYNLLDRMMVYVQQSLTYLGKTASLNTNLLSLWKVAGDCCTIVFVANKESIRLSIPPSIIPPDLQSRPYLDKSQILKAGARYYAAALRLDPNSASLWYDLGVNYLRQAECSDNIDRRALLNALESLKNSIRLNSKDPESWSALGVTACKLNNPALAQHAFIKSLLLSTQNSLSWTNLGILYLQYGNIELAHEAFKRSQSADPYYIEAWIGQILREILLILNYTQIEGCLGYASWVCQTIVTPDKKLPNYSQYRNPIKQATDGLVLYTDRIRNNPCAYNLLGILYEQQSLYSSAIESYSRSLKLLKDNTTEKVMVLRNYCRVLRSAGKFKESIDIYNTLSAKDLTFDDKTGLSLNLFFSGRFKESYAVLEEAIKMNITSEEASHGKVLKAIIAYAAGDAKHAKVLLLQVSQMQPANRHGLLALAYLAILLGDGTLLTAVLAELMKISFKNEQFISRYSLLFSAFYKLQNDNVKARNFICKMIHEKPEYAVLWRQLGNHIIASSPEKSSLACKCARTSRILNIISSPSSLALEATGLLTCKIGSNDKTRFTSNVHKLPIRVASKVVFLKPDNPYNWAVLGTAIAAHNRYSVASNTMKKEYLNNLNLKVWAFTNRAAELKKQVVPKELKYHVPKLHSACIASLHRLQVWLTLAKIRSLVFSSKVEEAKEFYLKAKNDFPEQASEIEFLLNKSLIMTTKKNSAVDLSPLKLLNVDMKPHFWKEMAELYTHLGMMKAAEYCYRRYLKMADKKTTQIEALFCLAHLALRAINYQDQESHRWLALGQEAISEIMKQYSNNSLSQLFASLFSHHDKNLKNAYRFSKQLLAQENCMSIDISRDSNLSHCSLVSDIPKILASIAILRCSYDIAHIVNHNSCKIQHFEDSVLFNTFFGWF
ncbi:uncharacterized protein TRIADDRAFT_54351 [Trichoplax adhaerens]|uniref:Tetratricopeptide repeat protein 37 n=1 Tax=Trichoplax adhaerens TaxID=10228 RepID=B3RRS9_TRIAD|nr:hypothetical protein TRIADDRAFT_54351 [Trichoplax adhaerens]EDV26404.1 hypothetical protein TRIADDRAFT_54351 [Trichoplax adhaerens]|eukprot:XP_002110400.1 hypothetical protein TRIADDRAFT_54351 [Trichoplax adhaerens]